MSMMRNDGKKLFQNVLFRKLFYSYLVIITLCALIYSAFLIYENHTFTERRMEAHTLQTADEIDVAGWWTFWPEVIFDDDRTACGRAVKVFVYEEGK